MDQKGILFVISAGNIIVIVLVASFFNNGVNMKRLHQLRLYFILYIVIRILIDVFYGKEIIINTFRSFTPFSISQYISSPGIFYVIIFFTYVFTFIIGLILFHYLIEKKAGRGFSS